jgi:hypothetical protein
MTQALRFCTENLCCRLHLPQPVITCNQRYKSVAFSPQANYTNWTTADGRRILTPTIADRGVSRGQRGIFPTVVNLGFLERNL